MTAAQTMSLRTSQSWDGDDDLIYCESICQLGDVFYEGSEDEDYEDPKIRRQRYEAAGQRYLQGATPLLLSATLRGPFDKSSGWTNPWKSRKATKPVTAPKQKSLAQSCKPEKAGNGILFAPKKDVVVKIEDASRYLPSPESLKQAVHTQPDTSAEEDSFNKVYRWRDGVKQRSPKSDPFWASTNKESSNTKKRGTSGSEWLKKSSAKRQKLDSHDLAAEPEATGKNKSPIAPSSPSFVNAGPMGSPLPRKSPRKEMLKSKQNFTLETENDTSPAKIAAATLSSPVSLQRSADSSVAVSQPSLQKHNSNSSVDAHILSPTSQRIVQDIMPAGGALVDNDEDENDNISLSDDGTDEQIQSQLQNDMSSRDLHQPKTNETRAASDHSDLTNQSVVNAAGGKTTLQSLASLTLASMEDHDQSTSTCDEEVDSFHFKGHSSSISDAKQQEDELQTQNGDDREFINHATAPRQTISPTTLKQPQAEISEQASLAESIRSPLESVSLNSCGTGALGRSQNDGNKPSSHEHSSKLRSQDTDSLRAGDENMGISSQFTRPLTRVKTPEPQFDFKSFASFMSPSPDRRRKAARISRNVSRSRTSTRQLAVPSALKAHSGRSRPNLRVTWAASLDDGGKGTSERSRAASPPPEADLASFPSSDDTKFSKHFEAMAARSDDRRPTASPRRGSITTAERASSGDKAGADLQPASHTFESGQSSRESPEPMDIVEDIFEEMGEFLEAWDVETELDRARKRASSTVREEI